MSNRSPYGTQATSEGSRLCPTEELDYKNVRFQVPDELVRLGHRLQALFCCYKSDRIPFEREWVKAYNQFNGYYDPDVVIRPGRSRIYPMETWLRVSIVHSRLIDLLFPNSKTKNWKLTPTKNPDLSDDKIMELFQIGLANGLASSEQFEALVTEYAAAKALRMERVIEDQLQEVDYRDIVSRCLWDFLIYGKSIAKGAAYAARSQLLWTNNGPERSVVLYPNLEYVRLWDFFPDVSAVNLEECDGMFQRYVMARHDVESLAQRPGFFTGRIMEYLANNPKGDFVEQAYEQEIRLSRFNGAVQAPSQRDRYEVVEYWGRITGQELHACGCYDLPKELMGASFVVNIWLLGNKVIRLPHDFLPPDTQMFHSADFMENRENMFDYGFVRVQAHNQRALSSIARQLLDNAAAVCGPTTEVNVDLLEEDSRNNLDHEPFKIYKRSGFSNDAAIPAVRNIAIDSHIAELIQLYGLFKANMTEETSTPPSTAYLTGGEALRTTQNMSMAIGATAVTLRGIIEQFDKFTKQVITAFVAWNNAYNPDKSIRGDTKVITTGAASMVTKEARVESLARFKQSVNPIQQNFINWHAVTEAERDVLELDDRFVIPEAEAERQLAGQREASQMAAEAEARKLESEVELNKASSDTKRILTEQKERELRMKNAELIAKIGKVAVENDTARANTRINQLKTSHDIARNLAPQASQPKAAPQAKPPQAQPLSSVPGDVANDIPML